MTEENLKHLYHALRHPTTSFMQQLLRQQNQQRKFPQAIKKKLYDIEKKCMPCNLNQEVSRIPKVAIPHEATPNIFVSIDIMHHKIGGKNVSFMTKF